MSKPQFITPHPEVEHVIISFPVPAVLLAVLNRPQQLNCINSQGHQEQHALFQWMNDEPTIRCGIISGQGRAFCAGADLIEWNSQHDSNTTWREMPSSGFGGISRRSGKKPIICPINGLCLGGGCEIAINSDLVIASSSAQFAQPEVKRGLVALAGALPRLPRIVGRQRAMDLVLTGSTIDVTEAYDWGLVNRIAPDVVEEAIRWAEAIAENSPDAVIVSREGIKMGWEGVSAEEGTIKWTQDRFSRIDGGDNMVEGIRAFVEKRKPRWQASKL